MQIENAIPCGIKLISCCFPQYLFFYCCAPVNYQIKPVAFYSTSPQKSITLYYSDCGLIWEFLYTTSPQIGSSVGQARSKASCN